MEQSKKFLHDKIVLLLITVLGVLLVIGVSVVLLRFDVSKNPTTVVAYRPNITGTQYLSGKPIDIYSLAIFMVLSCTGAVFLSSRIYNIRRQVAVFLLASTVFLMVLAIRVAWSLI